MGAALGTAALAGFGHFTGGAPEARADAPSWFDQVALPGHSVKVLATGRETYDERLRLIRGAQSTIYLSGYAMKPDAAGLNVLTELCKKAQDHRDVRLILDSFGSKDLKQAVGDTPGFEYTHDTRSWKVWFFEDCGGYLEFDDIAHSGPADLLYVIHEKLLIVDGKTFIAGGSGYGNHYYQASRTSAAWHDLDAEISGPAACWFHRKFVDNWKNMVHAARSTGIDALGGGGMSDEAAEHFFGLRELRDCAEVAAGDARVAPSYNNPLFSDGRPNLSRHLDAIAASNAEITLYAPYFVPGPRIVEALVKARTERHVKVTVLTNSPWSSDDRLEIFVGMYHRIKPLMDAGVEIRMWKPQSTLHRKGGSFDHRWVYFGSDNQDNRGQEWSSESIAYTDDPATVLRMDQEIAADRLLTFPLTPEFIQDHLSRISGATRAVAALIEDML